MRMFIGFILFLAGLGLAAAPALAGHLDLHPVDWGCWSVVVAGLVIASAAFKGLLEDRPV